MRGSQSRQIDLTNETNLMYLRVAFGTVVALVGTIYAFVYMTIQRKNGATPARVCVQCAQGACAHMPRARPRGVWRRPPHRCHGSDRAAWRWQSGGRHAVRLRVRARCRLMRNAHVVARGGR